MTGQELADGLGLSVRQVRRLTAKGMPVYSIEAAEEWRQRHVLQVHRGAVDEPGAVIEGMEAAVRILSAKVSGKARADAITAFVGVLRKRHVTEDSVGCYFGILARVMGIPE